MVAPLDLLGKVFGFLEVIEVAPSEKTNGKRKWKCKCTCGRKYCLKYVNLLSSSLQLGRTKSCGSRYKFQTPNKKRHEHRVWGDMRDRCNRPNNSAYKNYGGRGITVCKEWDEFMVFLDDMGECPSPDHELDRIDVNGNYCKENCRWVTRGINAQNKNKQRAIGAASKYIGVCFNKRSGKWNARLGKDNDRIWLGVFTTDREAALAYNKKALEIYGPLAKLNKIEIPSEESSCQVTEDHSV